MNRFKKFIQSLKSRGFIGTFRWVTFGYFRTNKFIVFYLNLEKDFNYQFPEESITFAKLSLDELQQLRESHDNLPVEFFCDRTEGFKTPFVAFVDGKLAAIHWLVGPQEPSRFLNMQEQDVELNFNTVIPEFRGHKLAEPLMAFLLHTSKQEGKKRAFGVAHVDNIAMYKQVIRVGFEPVEIINHFGHKRPKATLKYVK
ncbi:MAG: GNAT family N-acetyltransferase [Pseudomonadota bacterium]